MLFVLDLSREKCVSAETVHGTDIGFITEGKCMMNDSNIEITGKNINKTRLSDRIHFDRFSNNDYHIHSNGNPSSRALEKPRHYTNEEYSSSNRIANDCLNYSSMRLDRQKTNRGIYTPPLTTHPGGLSPTDLYYSSTSTRDRNSLSHYPNSERNRYPSPPHPHPSVYR